MTPQRPRVLVTDPNLRQALQSLHGGADFLLCAAAELAARAQPGDLVLLDDAGARAFLAACPEERRPSVVVACGEREVPEAYAGGLVDDLLSLPARAVDVERMLRTHDYVQALRDLEHSSRAIPGLVRQLQEDIQLAEKIQRRLIRDKFPPLGPLSVKSKYWCGLKAGGDYFDVFEFPGNGHAGVILADSSSYALSTSFIGSLMQFSVHVGRDELEDPARIVRALFGKLREGMKEKDRLSLLYGILDRRTFEFRYVACGPLAALTRSAEGKVTWGTQGEAPSLTLASPEVPEARALHLEPGDRLLLASDGWSEALGVPTKALFGELAGARTDAQDLLNEMAFRLRRKLERESGEPAKAEDDFPMPPQDCSVLVFDLAQNTLRLARKG